MPKKLQTFKQPLKEKPQRSHFSKVAVSTSLGLKRRSQLILPDELRIKITMIEKPKSRKYYKYYSLMWLEQTRVNLNLSS